MKQIITIIVAVFSIASAHAESDLIRIGAVVQEGESVLTTPTVIVTPGKKAQISVSQNFIQDSNLSLPTGVILDTVADFKDGKIIYSILLTIRETKGSNGDATVKAVSTFQTRELMLCGAASSGEKVEARLDDKTTLTISLDRTNLDDKAVTSKSN